MYVAFLSKNRLRTLSTMISRQESLVYLLAATYENFYERFTEQEHKQIEKDYNGGSWLLL